MHAFLAPSSAHRWVRCAYSPTLEAAYPETEESPEAAEGTAAHWVIQMALQDTPAAEGMQAPNGVAVTREMLEAAVTVYDDIAATLGDNWRQRLIIEQRVAIPSVHAAHNWGTPDYYAWDGNTLFIWDFKFGHEIVEAVENWQMIDYAAGILDGVRASGVSDLQIVVAMTVVQPRAMHRDGPVRRWRVRASALRPYINQLANAAQRATGPHPDAVLTVEGCKNCKGRHACETLQRGSYAAAAEGQRGSALDMSPVALGRELRYLTQAAGLLNARISGLQAQAEALLRAGTPVAFWAMEPAAGRLSWTKPAGEVFMLGQMLGVEFQKPPEPITPTQAKAAAKLAAKGAGLPGDTYDKLIDSYAARPVGAVKLVADDGTKARLTFSASDT